MSEPAVPPEDFYVAGGTLRPGTPSYVERRADTDLYEHLLAGDFCYVLTPRQMGKSSLMARTAKRLEEAGIRTAVVDLTRIGKESNSLGAEQWYYGVAHEIHRRLKIARPLRDWWQERAGLPAVQRLTEFFRDVVLESCSGKVVVFIDEIDSTIGLPFADDFFAALRACYNERATDPVFGRLTFVLLGVATPDQLIRDPTRTPFNIGHRIDLTDFTRDEAGKLAEGLHADPAEAERRLERILDWTGGHPYLTQALCRAAEDKGDGSPAAVVDPIVEDIFLSSRAQREETNLKHARARLTQKGPQSRQLLQLYLRVRQGQRVPDEPTFPLFAQLKLSGIVKVSEDGNLVVRNRIYERVFNPAWVQQEMPADRGRQLAAATLAASLVALLAWYGFFYPRQYMETFRLAIRDDAYNVAKEAYDKLHANPFSRFLADGLMAEFWEQRAMQQATRGNRDESLLYWLQAIQAKDSERRRRYAQNLVGDDYGRLISTQQFPAAPIMDLSPDGRLLLTGGGDGQIRLRDLRTGVIKSFNMTTNNRKVAIFDVSFSPSGRTFLVLFNKWKDISIQTWDIHGKPAGELKPRTGFMDMINTAALHPQGNLVATGDSLGNIQIWDLRSGKPIGDPMEQKNEEILGVRFSPDGRMLATRGSGDTVRLWENGSESKILRHRSIVNVIDFSANGKTLLTGSVDGTIRLWDVESGKLVVDLLQDQSALAFVSFAADAKSIFTGSSKGTVRRWSTAPATQPEQSRIEVPEARASIILSPNGELVLIDTTKQGAGVWHVNSKGLAGSAVQLRTTRPIVFPAVISPNNRTALTAFLDGPAQLWHLPTGKTIGPPLEHEDQIDSVALSPDGQLALTGGKDGTAQLWHTDSGMPFGGPLEHDSELYDVGFSSDGKFILTVDLDGMITVWDLQQRKIRQHAAENERYVTRAVFSPDDTIILTSGSEGIKVWPADLSKPFDQIIYPRWSHLMEFTPEGSALLISTGTWLNVYRIKDHDFKLVDTIFNKGDFITSFGFPQDCVDCVRVALWSSTRSARVETLRLNELDDPPIQGDPKDLLEEWSQRLGLQFDKEMKVVPRSPSP